MFRKKRLPVDPEWLKLKDLLSQTWKDNPVNSISLLRIYLKDFSDPSKIRRVENYLTGTRFHPMIKGNVELCDLLCEINQKK